MKFKGGVIIVGSLLWEDTPERIKWRNLCLQMEQKIPVSVPIRYGRKSSSRQNTYTMIFSNHASTKLGQAFIMPLKEEIKNYNILEKNAFAMAKAEGIWGNDDATPTINKRWGTLGLLINPKIDATDKVNADLIRNRWQELYKTYDSFDPSIYNISQDDVPVIDQQGFLQLPWTEQMNEFDFLLATPTVPNPHRILSALEISGKMNETGYWSYFKNNVDHGIATFQDEEITKLQNML
ncbi:hypothetical protein ACTJIJ_24690 [Niabella sp. 22666]|uniref:hypothetical protein n=1 Tax=Niabella sp. 22666 TaxID=3453954 RepID=UPI003F861D18